LGPLKPMNTTLKTAIKFSPVDIEERKKLDIRPGDTVRVSLKIVEKGKTRLQDYEGMVIARKHGTEAGATITVRKVASGVGMEKILPLYSPIIAKIEILRRSKTRRAKLYFIREKAVKEVKKKMKQLRGYAGYTHEDAPDIPFAEADVETTEAVEAVTIPETN